ncbi:MAG: hypothetical protein AAF184_09810 [Pseudomonadota bacterium]
MRTPIHQLGDLALREWAAKREGYVASVPSPSMDYKPSAGFGGRVPRVWFATEDQRLVEALTAEGVMPEQDRVVVAAQYLAGLGSTRVAAERAGLSHRAFMAVLAEIRYAVGYRLSAPEQAGAR